MALKSWVVSANDGATDFALENLPYGVFRHQAMPFREETRIGVAIGDQILDLRACAREGQLAPLPAKIVAACEADVLNPLMALGTASWSALRGHLTAMLDAERASTDLQARLRPLLVAISEAELLLPAQIGDFTDFYASIHHATRVGKLFRPDNPLLPNYKYIPIGYHGRASSLVVSGGDVQRPYGQTNAGDSEPVFGPTRRLDYEMEVGFFVGPGNKLGLAIPIAEAEQHIFGLCLVNDWSARDIQAWEYQPLGPFLAKSFATSISPWVIPMEALAPYRVPATERPEGDPAPLAYLSSASSHREGIDLTLEVYLDSREMRNRGAAAMLMGRSSMRDLYWTLPQMLTHHASNGCNLRPGDLLATGTVSGAEAGSEGCLLEKQLNAEPIRLPTGEVRTYLEDGDRITLRAYAEKPGLPRIGFGESVGTIAGSSDAE